MTGKLDQPTRRCAILILSRHVNESVIVGDYLVTVTVVAIRGDSVRLGFTADRTVPVHREEVARAILRDGGTLAGSVPRPPRDPDPADDVPRGYFGRRDA